MNENSALAVFNIVNVWGAIVINWSNCLSDDYINIFQFRTFSLFLPLAITFSVLPNSFIGSFDNNFSL